MDLWTNFKRMPLILKFLTVHALACLFFFLSSAFPHNLFSVDGRSISFSEWWNTGAGISGSILGTFLPLSGYLFLKRAKLARPFYLGSMLMAFYSPLLFFYGSKYPPGYYFSSLMIVLFLGGYLYIGRTAKDYFASNNDLKPTT